jgi:hypothetical protein
MSTQEDLSCENLVLMNSSMMPAEGNYSLRKIELEEFKARILAAKNIKSSIGYENVAKMISELTGRDISTSRELTLLNDGDEVLVMKLAYRIDPARKGWTTPPIEDYEFSHVRYKV